MSDADPLIVGGDEFPEISANIDCCLHHDKTISLN